MACAQSDPLGSLIRGYMQGRLQGMQARQANASRVEPPAGRYGPPAGGLITKPTHPHREGCAQLHSTTPKHPRQRGPTCLEAQLTSNLVIVATIAAAATGAAAIGAAAPGAAATGEAAIGAAAMAPPPQAQTP